MNQLLKMPTRMNGKIIQSESDRNKIFAYNCEQCGSLIQIHTCEKRFPDQIKYHLKYSLLKA